MVLIGQAVAETSTKTMAGQMEQMGAILGQQLMKTAEVCLCYQLEGDDHDPLLAR